MKNVILLTVSVAIVFISGIWVAQALGQVTTPPTSGVGDKVKGAPKVQAPVSVPGIPAQFDLETRVEVLERQVAQLQSKLNQLADRVNELDVRFVPPARSDPSYTGPQLNVPVEKKRD
jgi:hypothetical protein